MQEWDKYRETKIQRGELVDRIKNNNQKKWIEVCEKLGLVVSTEYGRGSHAVVYKQNCPPEEKRCCIVTLVKDMRQEIQRDIFKKILTYGLESNLYSEDDIWRELGIKVKK
ncbi:MAG: hypothetical protein Q7K26_02875 [bacterium]|nr:hypothetical protein [bacterium]